MDSTPPTYTEQELGALVEVVSRDNEALAAENAALARDAAEASRRAAEAEASLDAERSRAAELEGEVKELRERVDRLLERIAIMNAEAWAPSSERCPRVADGQLLLAIFNDVEAASEGDAPEPVRDGDGAAEGEQTKKKRRRTKRKKRSIDDLEVTNVVDIMPDETECPACGGELSPMGYDTVRVVEYAPASLGVTEYRVWKSVCKRCSEANRADGGETPSQIVRAERPALPLPGTWASASLLAHVIDEKYEFSMPIDRVWESLYRMGLPVESQTLCRWVIGAWESLLEPFESEVWRRMRGRPVLQLDETSVQVLKEPGREPTQLSYMWVGATGEFDAELRAVHFEYHPSRKHEVAGEMLGDYAGHVVSDGYGAYDDLGEKVTNSRCCMHIRRPFAKIVKAVGEDAARDAGSLALRVVESFKAIYREEGRLAGLGPDERLAGRLERVLPLMDDLLALVVTERDSVVPGTALANGVDYAIDNLRRMAPCFENGLIPLDNGHAERAIRPFAVGRRNWLFSDTVAGARASAGIYSVVGTAKMNGLDPERYVEFLIGELAAGMPTDAAGWDRLMPWSDGLPDVCRPKGCDSAADAGVDAPTGEGAKAPDQG